VKAPIPPLHIQRPPHKPSEFFKKQALGGFAQEVASKVQELSLKRVDAVPRSQMEVSALKAQLGLLIDEIQRIGPPATFFGPHLPPLAVAPPLPIAPGGLTPPTSPPPVVVSNIPQSASASALPPAQIAVAPGFSISQPAQPWDLSPPSTPPPPLSPAPTVFAQTPNVGLSRQEVYDKIAPGVINATVLDGHLYSKDELRVKITAINNAIFAGKAPGLKINITGNKPELTQRIQEYADTHKDHPLIRPYAPITPSSFPPLPPSPTPLSLPLSLGPTLPTPKPKPDPVILQKAKRVFDTIGIDPVLLVPGGYTTDQLKRRVEYINNSIDTRNAPGRHIPISDNWYELEEGIRDYVRTHYDDPYYTSGGAGGSGPVKKGKGISMANKWHPFSRQFYIHYPKFGQGIFSISRKRKNGSHEKIEGFPNRRVSKAFQDALLEILKKQRLTDLSELPEEEREYLYQLLALAEPEVVKSLTERQKDRIKKTKANIKSYKSKANMRVRGKEYLNRLTLLVGEAMAGNKNNLEIVSEGTKLLNTLIKGGIISKEEGQRIQKSLHG
jgi:hypothetical protein